MAISGPVGLYIPRAIIAQKENRELQQTGDSDRHNSEVQADDASDSAVDLKNNFLNSLDEISSYIAQIRNRRDIEKRNDFFSDPGLDYVLDEEAHEKIEHLTRIVKSEAKGDARLLLSHARAFFEDPSCLIMALRVLLRRMSLFRAEAETISDALEEAEEESEAKTTKAGINIALKARLYGRKLRLSPASVRTAYRDFLQSEEHELSLYEKWVVFYGPERRHILIDFMEKALLTDIEASDPSCNDAEFGYLINRLSQIKLIRSVDLSFINKIKENSVARQYSDEENKWILFLILVLTDPDEVYKALKDVGGITFAAADARGKALFIQSVYTCCQVINGSVYSQPEFRETLLQNLQALISDATLLESGSVSLSLAVDKNRLKA